MFNKKIERNDFSKAPIFYKCPVCKETGFGYIGNAIGLINGTGARLFRCKNCNIVIAED